MSKKKKPKSKKKVRRESAVEKDLLDEVERTAAMDIAKEIDKSLGDYMLHVDFGEARDGSPVWVWKGTDGQFTLDAMQVSIKAACDDLATFLQEKNRSYKGSAFRDITYCGKKVAAEDTIDVRIVDKIRRLQSDDPSFNGEDAEQDLLGYLLIKQALKALRKSA